MHNPPLAGLYAITDARETDPGRLIDASEQALRGGVRMLQFRDKSDDTIRRRQIGTALRTLTRDFGALLIINDDVELAVTTGANGVHLGRDDADLRLARQALGPDAIIGVSCYNQFELAQQAAASGANYVAFGCFFPSRTKPGARQATPDLLQRAKRELDIPVAAIGGITVQNAVPLINAGARMLAMVDGLFGQPNIAATARRYNTLFHTDLAHSTLPTGALNPKIYR
jgi:thiamine-phosphate pyrophosphorylase